MFIKSPSKTIPDSRPKWTKLYPFSNQIKRRKTLLFGVPHTHMAYIWDHPLGDELNDHGGKHVFVLFGARFARNCGTQDYVFSKENAGICRRVNGEG